MPLMIRVMPSPKLEIPKPLSVTSNWTAGLIMSVIVPSAGMIALIVGPVMSGVGVGLAVGVGVDVGAGVGVTVGVAA